MPSSTDPRPHESIKASRPYVEKETEPALTPPGRNVKTTLPEGHYRIDSAAPRAPFPAGQINHKSETFLEVSQYNPMGVAVPLAAIGGMCLGVGGALVIAILYAQQPQEGLLALGVAIFGLLMAAYFARLFIGAGDRPDIVRFCRKTGRVHRMTVTAPGDALGGLYTPTQWRYRLESFDWSRVRGEIIQGMTSSGRSASIQWQLQLAVLDEAQREVIYRFPIGVTEPPGGQRRIELWEWIGRYMSDGPGAIPAVQYEPARHRRSFIQCLERYNPFLTAEYWPRHADSWLIKGILFVITVPTVLLLAPAQWAIARLYPAPDWTQAPAGEFDESPNDPYAQTQVEAEREYENYLATKAAYKRRQNLKYAAWFGVWVAWWFLGG